MAHTCSVCGGSGEKTCLRCGGSGTFNNGETCYYCQGSGKVECNVCDGTGKVDEAAISAAVQKHFDLRPAAIIKHFGLRRPIYAQLAAYGHMGREDLDIPWEKRDLAPALAAELL